MSIIIKNKEKIPKEIKNYYYFIPCYNVIKNEIYFFDFFTEKIILKPKKTKKIDDEPTINQALTVNNILAVSKIIKKTKDKMRKKRAKTKANFGNIKDPKKLNREDLNFKKFLSTKDTKNFINNNDDNTYNEINKSNTGKKKETKKKR